MTVVLTESVPTFVPRSGESWRHPFEMYEVLRERAPVHHVAGGDGRRGYYVLSRFADVFDAARDTATFSSARGLTFTYGEMESIGLAEAVPLVMRDPPDHTAFRRAVARGFTPRQVALLEPTIRGFVVERIEAARAEAEIDIVSWLFQPLASLVVAHYLGVPAEDRGRFGGWTEAIVAASAKGNPLDAGATVSELFEYFTALIDERRSEPGDDTISHLVNTGPDEPTRSLLEVLGFAFTMVAGGNDTMMGLLGGAAELLTARPGQRALLVEDPALIADAVEELLRVTSPVQGLARTATVDVELHGTMIPAGTKVLLLYASANRDPREFGADAAQLDVARRPRRILSFSYGAHHCLGAAAARLQARIVLEELLGRCPAFSVDAARGRFASGHFVRRYERLPFTAG